MEDNKASNATGGEYVPHPEDLAKRHSLADRTGLAETEEMTDLKQQILLVGANSTEFGRLYSLYQEKAEALADVTRPIESRLANDLRSAEIIAKLGLSEDAIEMYEHILYEVRQLVDDEVIITERQGVLEEMAQEIEGIIDTLDGGKSGK
jgi:hypothetical protein